MLVLLVILIFIHVRLSHILIHIFIFLMIVVTVYRFLSHSVSLGFFQQTFSFTSHEPCILLPLISIALRINAGCLKFYNLAKSSHFINTGFLVFTLRIFLFLQEIIDRNVNFHSMMVIKSR